MVLIKNFNFPFVCPLSLFDENVGKVLGHLFSPSYRVNGSLSFNRELLEKKQRDEKGEKEKKKQSILFPGKIIEKFERRAVIGMSFPPSLFSLLTSLKLK